MEREHKVREHKPEGRPVSINLSEPMFFWIFLLVVAIILNTLLTYTSLAMVHTSQYDILKSISNFLLYGPGLLILPLIAGAVIGAEVGIHANGITAAAKGGLLNAIYGSVIYVIAIIILYEVVVYVFPNAPLTLSYFINNWVAIPVVAFIVVIEAFAALSNSRKIS